MKITCTITDEEYNQIERYIECSEFRNPFQDEFVFYWPTDKFLFMLSLYGIEYYRITE
jgi:hypothetical protein